MQFEIERLQQLHQSIQKICQLAKRNASDIKIVAATKYANVEQMNRLISAGIKIIGENRIQEAQKKFPHLLPVKKHFIGHLQSNKAKIAVQLFDCVESVDSLELAQKINEECAKTKKIMPILLEVNIANDPQKFGFSAEKILQLLPKLHQCQHLKIDGLMSIIPFFENLEKASPYFRKMKVLLDFCKKNYPQMQTLSMGMSHDYKVAIEEGATEIRIGRYLFQEES